MTAFYQTAWQRPTRSNRLLSSAMCESTSKTFPCVGALLHRTWRKYRPLCEVRSTNVVRHGKRLPFPLPFAPKGWDSREYQSDWQYVLRGVARPRTS